MCKIVHNLLSLAFILSLWPCFCFAEEGPTSLTVSDLDRLNRQAEILRKQLEIAELEKKIQETKTIKPASFNQIVPPGVDVQGAALMQGPLAPALIGKPASRAPEFSVTVTSIIGYENRYQALLELPDGSQRMVSVGDSLMDGGRVVEITSRGVAIETKEKKRISLHMTSGQNEGKGKP